MTSITLAPNAPSPTSLGAPPHLPPVSEHFTRWSIGTSFFDVQSAPGLADTLGFSYQRLLAGQADIDAGRVEPLEDVMNALRAEPIPDRP